MLVLLAMVDGHYKLNLEGTYFAGMCVDLAILAIIGGVL